MVHRFGRGPDGRQSAGYGFRGISSFWPYVGIGRGGLPRCQYPGAATSPRYMPALPYVTKMTCEQELDLLKDQPESIKRELGQVEAWIRDLGDNK